jgi:hypothetical protein
MKAGALHVNQLSSPPSANPSNIGKGKISHLFEKTVVVISSEREKSFLTVLLPWASVSS